jgi:hypothetical protein
VILEPAHRKALLRINAVFTRHRVGDGHGRAFNQDMGISRPDQEIWMKTLNRPNQRFVIAGASAFLALAAMGMANSAHARDNLSVSVGIGVPGVLIGATNAYPVYSQPRPVYVQPRPVYVQPAPVYYRPAPVYYSAPPVYAVPQPIYYAQPHGWKHGHYKKHREHYGYPPGYYGQGYAPVYYQR